ncbi:tetratricopeptide repeat protein [Salinibacter ruber]|uniref:tetratricopeptide repeat protein n=1 Tax=Salinibacter ruber TaxID=146919 RepID=UPI000E572BBC|nr:tetratricopeptide repeat protein [Salinibacter ruber]MCS3757147.1 putative thioredoxin [Salinibacter ruber]
MSYEVNDFETDVLDASADTPVLVDFWAPWCGPCQQLSPVLESLAEATDDWTLVKVNVDDHPSAAQEYGVRGIPAVKLFVDGDIEAEFAGIKPKPQLESWLDEHLPSEEKSRIEEAKEALEAGSHQEAEHLLWPVLEDNPDHDEAQVLMARALAFKDPNRAQVLAQEAEVADPTLRQMRDGVETIARLLELAEDPSALPENGVKDTYVAALDALADQDFDAALDQFIDVVRTDRDYDDDGARKACVALFTLLGEQHPVTQEHRRTFDMALY